MLGMGQNEMVNHMKLMSIKISFGDGSKHVKTLSPCSSHQNSWDLWMFIPLKMVLIGIDPYPFVSEPECQNDAGPLVPQDHLKAVAFDPRLFPSVRCFCCCCCCCCCI